MYKPLDGPAAQTTLNIDTITVVEVKVGANTLSERGVVTIQPIDGKIYVYFGDGTTTPSAATVAAHGYDHPKSSLKTYEAGPKQPVYILAQTGTVEVKIAERA